MIECIGQTRNCPLTSPFAAPESPAPVGTRMVTISGKAAAFAAAQQTVQLMERAAAAVSLPGQGFSPPPPGFAPQTITPVEALYRIGPPTTRITVP